MIEGRELALAVLNLRGRPAEAIVTAAAGAGFDSLTLRLVEPKAGDHGHLVDDAVARRRLRTRMDDVRVGLLDVEVVRLRPDTNLDDLLPALDAAAELGARHVLTVCDDPEDERFVGTLAGFDARCAERGIVAALEFMLFSACHSLDRAVHLVRAARAAGAPGAGVLVDSLHLQRSGGTPEQVARFAAEDPGLFPYVQLCDAPRRAPSGGLAGVRDEAVTARLLPGDGELPLLGLLRALPPDVPICVETPVRELAHLADAARADAAHESTRRLLLSAASATL